jgi:hypothetical protein
LGSQSRALLLQVKANDASSRCFEQLDGQLAEQPEANHRDNIAQLHFPGAKSVKRNCPDGCKSRLVEADGRLCRYFCNKKSWYTG